MNLGAERTAVQNPFIRYAVEAGWTYLSPEEARDDIRHYHREGQELLAVMQLHALTHLVQFFYGATWNLSRKGLFDAHRGQAVGRRADLREPDRADARGSQRSTSSTRSRKT